MKKAKLRSIAIFYICNILNAAAATGPLFVLDNLGAETGVSMIGCLNTQGNKPISCQYLQSYGTSINFHASAKHYYPSSGIKILTAGYTPENLGFTCVTHNHGYCVLPMSNTQAQGIQVANQVYFSTAADPVLAMIMNPVNILNPIPQLESTPASEGKDITVTSLEAIFDANFCQLNTSSGVSPSAPQCQENINYVNSLLRDTLGSSAINLSNTEPFLTPTPLSMTSINYQKITYNTTVTLPSGNETFQNVSGGLFMPNIDKNNVKGVILYFAGSQLDKSDVGSNIDQEKTQLIGAVFASQGYIVVMPDLIGLGDDWQNVHPYVIYPTINVKTAIDMLNAVLNKITSKYSGLTSAKLFSTGISEGGAYALWFQTYLTTYPSELIGTFYQLTHSVGLSGAYNVSNITYNFLNNDVNKNPNTYKIQSQVLTNISKPLLAANTYLSYATYSLNEDYTAVYNQNFFNMDCSGYISVFGHNKFFPQSKCDINGVQVNLKTAFDQKNSSPADQIMFSALNKTTNGTPQSEITPANPGLLAVSEKNSAIPFVSSVSFADLNTNIALSDTLTSANVNLDVLTSIPRKVSIVSLNHDSVVTRNNFEYLMQQYPDKIKYAISVDETQLQVVSPFSYSSTNFNTSSAKYVPVDHTQFLVYATFIALGIFNTL